jgi:uncharacterized protein YjdB
MGCNTGGGDEDIPITSVVITYNNVEVAAPLSAAVGGADIQLSAGVLPADTTEVKTATWSSSNAELATVSDTGLVHPIAAGQVVITATTDGKKSDGTAATAEVTINIDAEPSKVESVAIMNGDAPVADTTVSINMGATLSLTAVVSPSSVSAADKVVAWSSSDAAVATVDSSTGAVTGVAEGTATITATTAGDKADGAPATASVTINVTEIKLMVYYQGANPPQGVTTTLPTIDSTTGRYVINNKNPTALFPSANPPAEMKDNLFVYLNKPVSGDFSLSARVKVTGFGDTTGDESWEGAFIGAFINYENGTTAETPFRFVGARAPRSTGFRMLGSRAGNTTSSTDYPPPNTLFTPAEYSHEYVYVVSRADTTYTIQMKHPKTGEVMAQGTRSVAEGSTQADPVLGGEVYVGFMLTDCEAEISNVVITEGTAQLFASTPAGSYTPAPAAAIALSAAGATPGTGFDDIRVLADVPAAGIQLSAAFTPVNATDDIAWTKIGDNGSVSESGLVTFTGAGALTVKAASTTNAAVYGEFKFNILDEIPPVASITIGGPNTVKSGFKIQLTATVQPVGASEEVDWSVNDTSKATIDTATGQLTGVSPGSVTVTATSYNGAGGAQVTATYSVTVEAVTSNTILSWTAGAGKTFTAGNNDTIYMAPDGTIITDISGKTAGTDYFSIRRTAGTVVATETGIVLASARFIIGSATTIETTSSSNVADGEFDFSAKVKLTIQYSDYTGSKTAYLYINNNTAGGANSVLGSSSAIQYTPDAGGGETSYTLDPATFSDHASLQHAFIQIRTQSDTSLTITGLTIERVTD